LGWWVRWVFDGGPDPHGKRKFSGRNGVAGVTYRENVTQLFPYYFGN